MNCASQLRSAAAVFIFVLAVAPPVSAAGPDLDRFKAEIDAFLSQLGPTSNGVLKWVGSDPYELRHDGDARVAVITNARLTLAAQQGGLTLDRVEIRQIGEREAGKLIELSVLLPKEMSLSEADGAETKITLRDATAKAVIEAQSGRGRETAITIASARIDQAKTGAWVGLGPLAMSSKLVTEPDGGWAGPVEFEVKEIGYFVPQVPIGGGIHRVAFSGRSAGPKLDDLNKLRDAVDALQNDDTRSPEAHGAAFLAVLPTIAAPFSAIRGEFAVDGLTVRSVTGEALVSLANAGSTIEITGLDTGAAAVRFSVRHEGLDLAPSILTTSKVPHRAVLDLGVGELGTEALIKILQAVSAIANGNGPGENENQQERQQAILQALGAAASLNPTFRIYDIAIDTEDVGMDLRAEAKGSPLAPKGYTAAGDLVIRGFDAIPKLNGGIPFAEYLPVLKELGIDEKAPDGTPRIDFHLASTPSKWITINENDVTTWFDGGEPGVGRPRLLKPADPPIQGNDVKNVQRALAAAKIAVEQDGIYNGLTAAAVARFQKQNGINVSGVVDGATRQRLGIQVDAPRHDGRN